MNSWQRLLLLGIALCLTVAAAAAAAVTIVPAIVGADVTNAGSATAPEISSGAAVVTRPEPASSIDRGELVSYTTAPGAETETALGLVEAVREGPQGPLFVIENASSPVSAEQISGEVWYHLPWLGAVREALGSPSGLFYLAGLLMVLVAAHQLVGPDRRRRRHLPGGAPSRGNPDDPANAHGSGSDRASER